MMLKLGMERVVAFRKPRRHPNAYPTSLQGVRFKSRTSRLCG